MKTLETKGLFEDVLHTSALKIQRQDKRNETGLYHHLCIRCNGIAGIF
jgi:hypothetical protein